MRHFRLLRTYREGENMLLSNQEVGMLKRVIAMYLTDEEKHFQETEQTEDRHIYQDLLHLSKILKEVTS